MNRNDQKSEPDKPDYLSESRSHDPLKEAWRDSSRFNSFWFTRGKELKPVQRIGYGILSFIYASVGLFFLSFFLSSFRAGDLMFIMWGLASAFLLYFGVRGIVNIFRFKRS